MAAYLVLLAQDTGGGFDPTPLLVAVLAGFLGSVPGVLAYRASTKANAQTERKVDGEAYERAQQFWEKQLGAADLQLERVRSQLDRISDQLSKEQDISNYLRDQIRVLQGQVRILEDLVAELQNAPGRTHPTRTGAGRPIAHDPEQHRRN
jgi:small-conductance mechanosensitive channel